MQGKRAYPNPGGFLYLDMGEYGFNESNKIWEIRPPGRHADTIPNARVIEHGDNAITVTGLIIHVDTDRKGNRREWRGWLEHGYWREA